MQSRALVRYAVVCLVTILLTMTTMNLVANNQQLSTANVQQGASSFHVAAQTNARQRQQEPEAVVSNNNNNNDNARERSSGRRLWRQANRIVTQYDDDVMRRLTSLTSRRALADDPEVVSLARDLIDGPPDNQDGIKHPRYIMKTPQAKKVDELTHQKKDSFFVECGALDGERSSNTIYLEKERHWTGLLVEMDPFFYTQLLGKNRQVWSINACLSPYNYITKLKFRGDESGRGTLLMHSNSRSIDADVPCFPLHTLLLAINRTRVDYFSLDVEGVEMPILKTIPWRQLDIEILSVEYGHGPNGKKPYVEYMTSLGYVVNADIVESSYEKALFVEDFIFVKNQSFVR